jgi:hypothetical protein
MSTKRKLLIYLLGILPLFGLSAQRTESSQFSCTSNCEFAVQISPETAVLCAGQQLKLSATVTGLAQGLSYNWSVASVAPAADNELIVDKTATYKLSVTDATGCEVVLSKKVSLPDEENAADFFAQHCFISLPVTYDGGSGIRNIGSPRMEDLVVTIEGLDNPINVSDIFKRGNIGGLNHFYSDNCEDFQIAKEAYEQGNTAWAHIVGEGADATLYMGANTQGTNNFGQQMVNAYHLFWESVSADDVLSAPINYLCGPDQFLESTIGDHWLDLLRAIVTCLSSEPKEGGFVPKCLWECAPPALGTRDIPFSAGLLDGSYQIITDLVDLVNLIIEIEALSNALLLYPVCHQIKVNELFYQKLENKTNDPDFFLQLKRRLSQLFSTVTDSKCNEFRERLKKVAGNINKTIDLFSDWENIVMVYEDIKMSFFQYLDELQDCSNLKKCNNAKYEQGKLLFNFASLFYGGGELKAFQAFASKFWSGIMSKLPSDQAKTLAKLMKDKSFKERVKKINENPNKKAILEGVMEDLPPKNWRKVVEDPELLDVWKRIKDKACPFLARSNLGPCDDLRRKVFNDLDADQIKKWESDALDSDFFNKFVGNKELVGAWDLVKHLDEGVRLNVNALGKLDNLLTSGKIPKAKLESALNSHLGDILNAADEVNVGKILDRLNLQHVDELHFDNIIQRLDNYPTLKQDLFDNPDWFDTFDDILKRPGDYWDIVDEAVASSDAALIKWGQGFWWKNLREKAKNFEIPDPSVPGSGTARSSFRSSNNLNANQVVDQVTLEVNGTKIRIDYLGKDASGKFHLGDAKFSIKDKNWSSEWSGSSTPNQSTVFPDIQSQSHNIVIKATDPFKISLIEQWLGIILNNGTFTIPVSDVGSLKIFGSAADDISVVKEVVQLL